jgi:hypothetical protein
MSVLLQLLFSCCNARGNPYFSSAEFTTINRYLESTADFDRVDDTRSFTSEALFSESSLRLNRSLSETELAGIVRVKQQFETFNNIRFRHDKDEGKASSYAVDLFYKYRQLDDAQITHFFWPNSFNDVNLDEYGIAFQTDQKIDSYHLFVRGSYKRINRKGVIEFLKDSNEDINQYELNSVISKWLDNGSEAVSLYTTYVYQDIELNIPNPFTRYRNILAALLTYGRQGQEIQLGQDKNARPATAVENIFDRRFDTRGLKFYSGAVFDIETFGDVDVERQDFYIGTSICSWYKSGKGCPIFPFDIGIEPTIFTSEVENSPSQSNSQYRTNITVYYPIQEDSIQSILLLVPVRYDVAIQGTNAFENLKAGVELRYSDRFSLFRTTKFYGSIRYDHQYFYNLGKNEDLFAINLSLTF